MLKDHGPGMVVWKKYILLNMFTQIRCMYGSIHSEVVPSIQAPLMANPYGPEDMEPVWRWNFGNPILADNLGDRILEVDILDRGDYDNTLATDVFSVDIEFNNTVVMNINDVNVTSFIDLDRDGQDDFREANLTANLNHFLTDFYLDRNGTYDDNTSGKIIERGLFLEDPTVYILDGSMLREVGPGVKLAELPRHIPCLGTLMNRRQSLFV